MAKNGTIQGGMRVGAGRKRKSVQDKILEGNKVERLCIPKTVPIEDIPAAKDYLSSAQKNGDFLEAAEVYAEIWAWLKARGCEGVVDTQLLEQYAVCVARWKQCEQGISLYGLKGRHPTTGGEMTSVYVRMSHDYLKLISQLRYQIYAAVRDSAGTDGTLSEKDDILADILRLKN